VAVIDLAPRLLEGIDLADGPALWASCGAAALTGRRTGPPLDGPAAVAPTMRTLALRFRDLSTRLGSPVAIDGPSLLIERAAITGHGRQGEVSCGGASRLVRAADGWVAVSLAREDDWAAVPAWLEADLGGNDVAALAGAIASTSAAGLVERAALLGIPCSALGEVSAGAVPAHQLGEATPLPLLSGTTVLDLSSLWAGPLCGRLLATAGARVIKVESSARPDGARRGPKAFFDLMNACKESVMIDLSGADGRRELANMIEAADVVIEASRPRALAQMGIDAAQFPGRVWLSITSHGRGEPLRVGFGDDAAVAGGLVAYDDQGPVFAADAIADPITGLMGAVAVLDRLVDGGRWLIDLSLAHAAALTARPPVTR
jgi:hypothetical protein